MSKQYLSQVELAKFCGCTQPYIAKLKKKGMFNDILENGKFPRSKSTELTKIIEDNKDENREPQRQANQAKKYGTEISHGKVEELDITEKKSFGMFDVSYISPEAQIELMALIETGKSSVQKIQIKDAFIESKKKEIEFKKELGVLIEIEQAEAVMELVASNMKTKIYNAAHNFKTKYPKTTKDQIEYLYMLIDDAFNEFNKYGIEDVQESDE